MTDRTPNPNGTTTDADLSGRQLGDFQLLRRLGRGSMAEVYLAEQGSLHRQVAIKVLKAHLATDDTYVRRFHNEAQAAARLIHAHIVQIHDVGCIDGIHYIAQEYVQGQNLQEFMVRHGPLKLRLALTVMRQVASALHKAAAEGIVHRDIKPENIMLARGGEVKVADFGLARLASNELAVQLTQVGVTMGTPLYMSPEQVEGRPLDPRSDIYSFGVTCYHMLSGAPPFTGETALSVAVQHLKTEPKRLESARPDLPIVLCRIVHKMLSKEPDERYASARELLNDLRLLPIEGQDFDWPADEDKTTPSETLLDRQAATRRLEAVMKTSSLGALRRRRHRLWFATGLVVFCLAGGALNWWTRSQSLLDEGSGSTSVPRQDSAKDQLFFGKALENEEWLKSVEFYFPDDKEFVKLSRQELAWLYLQQDRRAEAMRLFEEFSRLGDAEPTLTAFGLAGESVVLTLGKEYKKSIEKLAELWPMKERLEPRMAGYVRASLMANELEMRDRISRADEELTQKWIKDLEQEAPGDS